MKIKSRIIKLAMDTALMSDVKRSKVGAVAFTSSGNIITASCNKIIWGHSKKFTIHAEEYLLTKIVNIKALERLGKLYILVVRVKSSNPTQPSLAKPCRKCSELLKESGLIVYYSDSDGKIKKWKYEKPIKR
jgi:cytidine deaminase